MFPIVISLLFSWLLNSSLWNECTRWLSSVNIVTNRVNLVNRRMYMASMDRLMNVSSMHWLVNISSMDRHWMDSWKNCWGSTSLI